MHDGGRNWRIETTESPFPLTQISSSEHAIREQIRHAYRHWFGQCRMCLAGDVSEIQYFEAETTCLPHKPVAGVGELRLQLQSYGLYPLQRAGGRKLTLLEENHLPCLIEIVCLNPVKIHTACKTEGIERDAMIACSLVAVDKRLNDVPENIKHRHFH